MIMSEQTIPIPGRLKNVAIGGHVAGSEDIDVGGGKTQKQVNDETNDTLALHQSAIGGLNSQNYVSVSSYSSLPATGSADTIYRVSSYDGTQVDATKYAEYAWNGSSYVLLDVKTQVGEVFDISQYKAVGGTLAKFADLSAALDGGNNVPAGIRKGGMSIKFVQSSDNKYVQYRLMTDFFSIQSSNWQGVDEKPTNYSKNYVESGGIKKSQDELRSLKKQNLDLIQGYVAQEGYVSPDYPTRVCSADFIDCLDYSLTIIMSGDYKVRTVNKYNFDKENIEQVIPDSDKYTLEQGYYYKVTIYKIDESNITPLVVMPNTGVLYILDDKLDYLENQFNLKGESLDLVQGYITAEEGVIILDYPTRVCSNSFIDCSKTYKKLNVGGNFAIRTINKYAVNNTHISQIVNGAALKEYTFELGFKYKVTLFDTSESNITPSQVEPNTYLYNIVATMYQQIDENTADIENVADFVKTKYLIYDFFDSEFDVSNYENFDSSRLGNGKYLLGNGWERALRVNKAISFQNMSFEFDINTTDNTEVVAIATEETQPIVTGYYGSCAVIDFANKKLYLLAPSVFDASHAPNIANKVVEVDLTNVNSLTFRYKIKIEKRNRNIVCSVTNYYTAEVIEAECLDTTNSGIAGSGYDMLKIAAVSGAVYLNGVVGVSKLNPDVLFIGDSVADGRGIQLSDSWAYKLGQYLTDSFSICARSGGQIDQVIAFLDSWGDIIKPKMVIVAVGVNGGSTEAKYKTLYNKIKSINAIPVFCTVYNAESTFTNINAEDWTNYNTWIKSLPCIHIRFDLATSADPYAPTWHSVNSEYTTLDGVHPDAQGSLVLYNRAIVDIGMSPFK